MAYALKMAIIAAALVFVISLVLRYIATQRDWPVTVHLWPGTMGAFITQFIASILAS